MKSTTPMPNNRGINEKEDGIMEK
jgi:hypothetical protein